MLPAMATMKQALLWDFGYSAWANQLLLDGCSALTAEELDRDLGSSHRSITATLLHTYYAERAWLKRLRADLMPPAIEIGDQRLFKDPAPEPGLAELKVRWPEVSVGFRQYLEALPDADFDEDLCGVDCSMPRWKLMLHIVNHSTLHRGQVVSMIRQLGKQPPQTDLMSYYFEVG